MDADIVELFVVGGGIVRILLAVCLLLGLD